MLKVLLRSLPDVRAQLLRSVESLPRPLIVSQEPAEDEGGKFSLRQPYRYLLDQSAKVSMVVVADDPKGGLWRDPVGDLADRTFPDRRDANAAAAGYVLFFEHGQPDYLRRDLWDRHADTDALITRLSLKVPLPPRVKEDPPSRKRGRTRTAPGVDEPQPSAKGDGRHKPGPRRPAPPPGHRTRTVEDFEPPPHVEEEAPEPELPDPFGTLGLRPTATEDQVVKAFRALIVQYHPDKVAHLAPEFRSLAEKRTLELTDAYDRARKQARGD